VRRCLHDPLLAILLEHRLVTDGWTDEQTDGHGVTTYTVLTQRRAVKLLRKSLDHIRQLNCPKPALDSDSFVL